MAKFCSVCGRILKDDEVCVCQKNDNSEDYRVDMTGMEEYYEKNEQVKEVALEKKDNTNQNEINKGKQMASNIGDVIVDTAKNAGDNMLMILKNPVAGSRIFVKGEDFKSSIVLYVIQAFVSAVFTMICCIANNINIEIDEYKFSVFGGFLRTFFFSIMFSFLLSVLLFLITKIFKENLSYKKAVDITATKCVPIAVIDAAACILYIFSSSAGTLFFIISAVVGLIYMTFVYNAEVQGDDDSKLYIMVVTVAVFIIIFAVFASNVFYSYVPKEMEEGLRYFSKAIKTYGTR